MIALACAEAPEGQGKWTMRLLKVKAKPNRNLKIVGFVPTMYDGRNSHDELKTQIDEALKLAKRSKVWGDPEKQKKLEKVLADLRSLISDAV